MTKIHITFFIIVIANVCNLTPLHATQFIETTPDNFFYETSKSITLSKSCALYATPLSRFQFARRVIKDITILDAKHYTLNYKNWKGQPRQLVIAQEFAETNSSLISTFKITQGIFKSLKVDVDFLKKVNKCEVNYKISWSGEEKKLSAGTLEMTLNYIADRVNQSLNIL